MLGGIIDPRSRRMSVSAIVFMPPVSRISLCRAMLINNLSFFFQPLCGVAVYYLQRQQYLRERRGHHYAYKKNAWSYRIHLWEPVLSRYLLRTKAPDGCVVFVSASVSWLAMVFTLQHWSCWCTRDVTAGKGDYLQLFPVQARAVLAAKISPQMISVGRYAGCQLKRHIQRRKKGKNDSKTVVLSSTNEEVIWSGLYIFSFAAVPAAFVLFSPKNIYITDTSLYVLSLALALSIHNKLYINVFIPLIFGSRFIDS
jgi:hypothetical protein